MLEQILIDHCGPTLAGIKMGNLVSIKINSTDTINQIKHLNRRLNASNLYLEILKMNHDKILLYLYNYDSLTKKLHEKEANQFLKSLDYPIHSNIESLRFLKKRLIEQDFPHEIGIFLDYPTKDVIDFIRYKGKKFITIGPWKVYNDLDSALQTFSKYRRSTQICRKLYLQGVLLFEIPKRAKGELK